VIRKLGLRPGHGSEIRRAPRLPLTVESLQVVADRAVVPLRAENTSHDAAYICSGDSETRRSGESRSAATPASRERDSNGLTRESPPRSRHRPSKSAETLPVVTVTRDNLRAASKFLLALNLLS
jgi:hypothetical protein